MQEVTFTNFRNHAKRYFDSVEHGETVLHRKRLDLRDLKGTGGLRGDYDYKALRAGKEETSN
jgi:hypothetical protein